MRITHLSTYDLSGGAARAAYRLHRGLCSVGQESHVVALYKTSLDPTVLQFDRPMEIPTRFRRVIRRCKLERTSREISARPGGSSFFSDDRSEHDADVLRRLPPTDVLNLHWVAGFFDYRSFFRALPLDLPVVWTLHDMNPFTGGCHFDGGCGRYHEQCGACPQLGSSGQKDFSSQVWARKRAAFSSRGGQNIHLVAPSRWLAGEAGGSALFRGRAVDVIPYGIDFGNFQPRDRGLARQKLDIPREASAILFLADSTTEKRKGFGVLLEAMKQLESSVDLRLIAVGRGLGKQELADRCKAIDYLEDEAALSFVYSAADVFVLPTLQDNFPNTALEALACGLPVVGSRVGGVPEIVRDGFTGLLVEPDSPDALANGVKKLLDSPEQRMEMGANCRRVAVEEYSLERQARRYIELYESLLAARA